MGLTCFNFLFSFYPTIMILFAIMLFFARKIIGPVGTFYSVCVISIILLILSFLRFFLCLLTGVYFYLDLGRWFFCLDLIDSHLIFCGDIVSFICSFLVISLSAISMYFGIEYMQREAFIMRLLYLLYMFAVSVILLFFAYDFFIMLIAWELIGLFSFLLVNFYATRLFTVKSALKTLVFSRISDFFLFLAFIMCILVFSSTDLTSIFLQVPLLAFHTIYIGTYSVHFLTCFSACIAIAALVKCAQFFFHVWLPDAMEAPTPASSLIHSSTLVVAGVFIIIRFASVFEFSTYTNLLLILWGSWTIAFGAIVATRQDDIKKLVAYSTISQIGYLVCGCGFGCFNEVLLYLTVHALNKALLFMLVGFIVHYFSSNTDMRLMGGIYHYAFDTFVIMMGIAINLMGLPYSSGFFAKEFILFQVSFNDSVSFFSRSCWLVSFIFTPLYMWKLIYLSIFGIRKAPLSVYRLLFNYQYALYRVIQIRRRRSTWRYRDRTLFGMQHPTLCSHSSGFVYFFVWASYTFFGDSLMLLVLELHSPKAIIYSINFFQINAPTYLQSKMFSWHTHGFLTLVVSLFLLYAAIEIFFIGYLAKVQPIKVQTIRDYSVYLALLLTYGWILFFSYLNFPFTGEYPVWVWFTFWTFFFQTPIRCTVMDPISWMADNYVTYRYVSRKRLLNPRTLNFVIKFAIINE